MAKAGDDTSTLWISLCDAKARLTETAWRRIDKKLPPDLRVPLRLELASLLRERAKLPSEEQWLSKRDIFWAFFRAGGDCRDIVSPPRKRKGEAHWRKPAGTVIDYFKAVSTEFFGKSLGPDRIKKLACDDERLFDEEMGKALVRDANAWITNFSRIRSALNHPARPARRRRSGQV